MASSVPFLAETNVDGEEAEENRTLLPTPSSKSSWKPYHTFMIMVVRIAIDMTFKNFLSFYMNYADGLGLNAMEFAYVVIASEIGCMTALFFTGCNAKYLKNDVNIMSVYLVINGIACLLFIFPSWLSFSFSTLGVLIWCACCRFIIGVSFAFIYASSIHFSTKYLARKNQISSMIALLHYSWPLSTILNIFAGYVIQYLSWIDVWIFCGLLLIVVAVICWLFFQYKPVTPTQLQHDDTINTSSQLEDVSEESIARGLTVILTNWRCLVMIFVSFFMTFRSRTIYIVTTSLWMEHIYGLSASECGWTTMAIVVGEVLGLMGVQLCAWRVQLKTAALVCLLIQLLCGSVPLLVLTWVYGNTIDGSLWIAIVLIVSLSMGHESFYVIQQTNAVTYAPSPRHTTMLLLLDRLSQEIGAIFGLWLVATLWLMFQEEFIFLFAVIWTVASCVEMVILFIYKEDRRVADAIEFDE